MRRDRLQNRIASSEMTLPVCAILAILVWWFPLGQNLVDYAIGLVIATLIAYVLLEVNNRFQLIRVRSRMVSSTWILFAGATASIHAWHHGTIVALAFAIAHFFLFNSYEKRQPISDSFHMGLFLGIAILFIPWFVVFVPLFIIHQTIFLRSMTTRCCFATLLGALFPAFVALVTALITDEYSCFGNWYAMFMDIAPITGEEYLSLTLQQIVSFALPFLLALLGGLHYLSTSYNDKISVRMLLYILVVNAFIIQIFIALQPKYLELVLPSMLVCSAPLIAHFFALTKSWFTNFLFVLSTLCIIGLGVVTLYLPTISINQIITSANQ